MFILNNAMKEKIEDTKRGITRGRNSKRVDKAMIQRKRSKRKKRKIYKTLYRKLNIEEREPHLKPDVKSSASEGVATWYLHKQGVNKGCYLCNE